MSQVTKQRFDPHAGTIGIDSDRQYYRDFGGYWPAKHAITVDHVIDANGNVRCEINATPLEEL